MFTNAQKEVLRLMIHCNPEPEYMKQLGESDAFAIAEIDSFKALQLPIIAQRLAYHSGEVADLTNQLSILDAV